MMTKGSLQDWKIHDDQQVDQNNGAEKAEQQARERAFHGLDLSAYADGADFRRLLRRQLGDDLADVGGDGTEIAVLHGSVDLHHTLQVVL